MFCFTFSDYIFALSHVFSKHNSELTEWIRVVACRDANTSDFNTNNTNLRSSILAIERNMDRCPLASVHRSCGRYL